MLADKGVVVVPDILANAGGVVVSYFEWVQANQTYWWTDDEVEEKLERRMRSAYDAVSALGTDPCSRGLRQPASRRSQEPRRAS